MYGSIEITEYITSPIYEIKSIMPIQLSTFVPDFWHQFGGIIASDEISGYTLFTESLQLDAERYDNSHVTAFFLVLCNKFMSLYWKSQKYKEAWLKQLFEG